MRKIDADAMKAEVESLDAESNNRIYQCAMEDMMEFFVELIDKQPTIEAEPVRHGLWIVRGQEIYCSECNEESLYNPFGASKFSRFCPNCGADMEMGVSEDERH